MGGRVPAGTGVTAIIEPNDAAAREALAAESATIQRLAKIDALSFEDEPDGVGAHAVLSDGTAVFVPLGDAIDVKAECTRLTGEAVRLDKQLDVVARKLANDNFVSRAPEDVVAREREKEQAWREQRDTLSSKLRSLGC